MTYRLVLLLFCLLIHGLALSGCTGLKKGRKSGEPPEVRLEKILLERALEYERKGEFPQALQAYEAALAVVAVKKGRLEASLRNDAEIHYRRGLELKKQGQYAKDRHEFLVALRLWPEFPEVVEQLKPSQPTPRSRYLVHKVKEGEFLTAIAQEYYNDESTYEIIARYNNLEDAAKLIAGMELKIPEIAGVSFGPEGRKQAAKPSADEKDSAKMAGRADIQLPGDIKEKVSRQAVAAVPTGGTQAATYPPPVAGESTITSAEEMPYDPADIHQELGVSLIEEGQYLAALHEFQKVLNLDPGKKQVRKYMSRAHYRQGETLFRQAEYSEARRHFQEALKLDKQCTACEAYMKRTDDAYKEAHYLKGIQLFEEERLQEAIEEWQLVSELDSDYKQVQNYLLRAQKLIDKVQELKEAP
jgi:tetratricopeptide (TPR) repeat protein